MCVSYLSAMYTLCISFVKQSVLFRKHSGQFQVHNSRIGFSFDFGQNMETSSNWNIVNRQKVDLLLRSQKTTVFIFLLTWKMRQQMLMIFKKEMGSKMEG